MLDIRSKIRKMSRGSKTDCKEDAGRDYLDACPSVKNEMGITGHDTGQKGGRDSFSGFPLVLIF